MAEITRYDFELDPATMQGGLGEERSEPRSPGIHLSGVIRDLEKVLGVDRQDFESMSAEQQALMIRYREMGFMWESIVESVFKRRMIERLPESDKFIRQQEVEAGGIFMTLDGIYVPNWTLLEYKATWRSARKVEDFEGEFWSWLVQAKCYCHAIDAQEVDFFVFFVNGDYKPPAPKTISVNVKFHPNEIRDTWLMVSNHAEVMRKRGYLGEQPKS